MCGVRIKVLSCLKVKGTKYDFIMSRNGSHNVYCQNFQSRGAICACHHINDLGIYDPGETIYDNIIGPPGPLKYRQNGTGNGPGIDYSRKPFMNINCPRTTYARLTYCKWYWPIKNSSTSPNFLPS